ncbi:pilus assembly protein [Stutzerimonas stutzeri]|uniref:pilus assembly protein n=1 Tax=Stutzerimonas stutzeri TaxID=316 RepID=UPI000BA994AD|nr:MULTISPECIES: PilC/PilY family type IV pilus protein [Pseudomonadaceae]MDH1683521.1 PilC/PilY family type IV pilus protein [Pseudomonas chengduensis]MDI9728091.1 PilC/PilY family type IV pilus protein [Stutzerimonas stutzeri]MDI9748413.1 PilC/PilY family type IV pilus protein [Stutzerimonas stutzeri]PAO92526.1 pilus assembly protein PilY [Stutzerimonas stutzeri]
MNAIRDIRARTLASTLSGIVLLSAANSYANVSQTPLSLTIGVPPNMLLTLDDSGSMRWAFAPDSISTTYTTRRAKSSSFNPIYYNPSISYTAPKVFTTAGVEQQLSTSFTKAWHNGFNTGVGSADLSGANYRVSWDVPITAAPSSYSYTDATKYRDTGTVYRLAQNPSADFSAEATISSKNPPSTVTTANGKISFVITRNSSSACTATATLAGVTITATCSGSSGNFTATLTELSVPPYYYIYDATIASNCTTANDSCYRLNFVETAERQNFANWYSFYRNRALSTVSAAALAFYDLSSSVRLSWQTLGNPEKNEGCTTFNGSDTSNCYNNAFKEYSLSHKGQLYAWLQNISFTQSTPLPAALKRAGEFYKTATPWQKNPNGTGNTTQNTYACRASYHILMTDGMWNAETSDPSEFRHDAATFDLPDGRRYSQRRPYYDTTEKTLADLAMHYWATDLNPNLANRIPAYIPFKSGDATTDYWDPRNDPATWQHMTNFIMGLGLTQSLNNTNVPWAGSTFTGTGYSNLVAGTANWPPAASSGANNANNVYDLWHAAINSRGEFFSVDTPEAMIQAFDDILKRIADRKSTAARPAINSGQVSADENDEGKVITVSYQTSYASDDNWSGDVKRFEKSWNAQKNAFETTQTWSATSKVPGWSNRNIKIAGNSNSGLVDFDWTNAGAANTVGTLAYWLNRNPENSNVVDNRARQRLEYLKGNRSGEGTTFRQRSGVLGDFYSSTPAVVSGARYLVNVTNALENTTTYTTFAANAARRTPRVYVGGNDGMLHAFNAKTGVEEFAFIPSAVFNKLNKLTGSNYSHEFYVEGTPVIADVFNGSEWRTILVGTLKAGGKSIFALDITTPGDEKLLWEFDDSKLSASTVKMGYSFAQPTIARLHTGKWAVVIGNGYESEGNTSGKAALFIIDAMQGDLLKSLEVQGTAGVANGLSTAKLGDFNADGVADYAYAGDLQGNMWRFDLLRGNRSESAPFTRADDDTTALSDFKVAYGGAPLFRATFNNIRQPITSAPSLVLHPNGRGYLVVFGTGKFFETGDKEGNKSIAQSVYGIWDKQTLGQASSNPGISRSSLQQQSISEQTTVSAADGTTRQGRVISNNAIDWSTQNGWYLNLVQSDGEMVVENMSQLGRTIFMQSLVPNDDPCGDGAANWTYALNPFTGGRTAQNSFDYVPTGDAKSTNISAIRQDGEGGGTISQNSDGGFQFCTGQTCANIHPDPPSIGRQTWRRVETED